MDGFIDVSGDDLTRIYALATLHAHQRGLGKITLGRIPGGKYHERAGHHAH